MGDRMSREQAMRLLNAMSDGFAMAVVAGTGVRLEKENIPQLCTAVATAITLLSQQEERDVFALTKEQTGEVAGAMGFTLHIMAKAAKNGTATITAEQADPAATMRMENLLAKMKRYLQA